MTEKSNSVGVAEVYDETLNTEDWGLSDLEGNGADEISEAETNELFPSMFEKSGSKTIEIYHEKFGTLWAARFVEGGKLPSKLKGKWTNPGDAKLAVDLYIADKESV
jgi:hypothetical protein